MQRIKSFLTLCFFICASMQTLMASLTPRRSGRPPAAVGETQSTVRALEAAEVVHRHQLELSVAAKERAFQLHRRAPSAHVINMHEDTVFDRSSAADGRTLRRRAERPATPKILGAAGEALIKAERRAGFVAVGRHMGTAAAKNRDFVYAPPTVDPHRTPVWQQGSNYKAGVQRNTRFTRQRPAPKHRPATTVSPIPSPVHSAMSSARTVFPLPSPKGREMVDASVSPRPRVVPELDLVTPQAQAAISSTQRAGEDKTGLRGSDVEALLAVTRDISSTTEELKKERRALQEELAAQTAKDKEQLAKAEKEVAKAREQAALFAAQAARDQEQLAQAEQEAAQFRKKAASMLGKRATQKAEQSLKRKAFGAWGGFTKNAARQRVQVDLFRQRSAARAQQRVFNGLKKGTLQLQANTFSVSLTDASLPPTTRDSLDSAPRAYASTATQTPFEERILIPNSRGFVPALSPARRDSLESLPEEDTTARDAARAAALSKIFKRKVFGNLRDNTRAEKAARSTQNWWRRQLNKRSDIVAVRKAAVAKQKQEREEAASRMTAVAEDMQARLAAQAAEHAQQLAKARQLADQAGMKVEDLESQMDALRRSELAQRLAITNEKGDALFKARKRARQKKDALTEEATALQIRHAEELTRAEATKKELADKELTARLALTEAEADIARRTQRAKEQTAEIKALKEQMEAFRKFAEPAAATLIQKTLRGKAARKKWPSLKKQLSDAKALKAAQGAVGMAEDDETQDSSLLARKDQGLAATALRKTADEKREQEKPVSARPSARIVIPRIIPMPVARPKFTYRSREDQERNIREALKTYDKFKQARNKPPVTRQRRASAQAFLQRETAFLTPGPGSVTPSFRRTPSTSAVPELEALTHRLDDSGSLASRDSSQSSQSYSEEIASELSRARSPKREESRRSRESADIAQMMREIS